MKDNPILKTILISSIISPFLIFLLFDFGKSVVDDFAAQPNPYPYPTQFASVPIVLAFSALAYSTVTSFITAFVVNDRFSHLLVKSFAVWCGPLVELIISGSLYIIIQDPLDNVAATFIIWIPYLVFTAIFGLVISVVGNLVSTFIRKRLFVEK